MWLVALKSCWKQSWTLAIRYIFNFFSGIVTMYMVFAMLFYGAKAIGGGAFNLGDTLEGLFTGYVVWMLVTIGYQDLAYGVTNEAQTGTLEQLYLSPLGYKWLAFFNMTFNCVFNLALVFAMVLVMTLTTGQKVYLDLVSIVPLFLFVYLQANGLGYALAGLALLFKRIQAFFQVVTFGVIGVFFVPWDKFPWARYLPFTMGRHLLEKVMMGGQRLWHLDPSKLWILLVTTGLYLGLGLAAFSLAERQAKSKGLLGQY